MEIKTLEVGGFYSAMLAMRNPLNSWAKSDSAWDRQVYDGASGFGAFTEDFLIGEKDKELSIRLQKAGPEHCKHLRMIQVWADITAPLTWWKQCDCYRFGVEKVSTSTMHTLMNRELTEGDFEPCNGDCYSQHLFETIGYLNSLICEYQKETNPDVKKRIWEYAIQNLPQSYLQKRTVMMSYAALRNIYRQREGHKLGDWKIFRDWVETLPESWMITE